jgi:hypothetical protein
MIVVERQTNLSHVVLALRSSGGFASLLYGRQQQGDQNGNDGNDYQQFNQGESARCSPNRHHGLFSSGISGKSELESIHDSVHL